ncbi:MAG: hypothetical protein JWN95_3673 [Frankiales bacterium]|nr:hypothetical protein [Frankiales bacterium]
MQIPPELIDRIVQSVQTQLPEGLSIVRVSPRAFELHLTPELSRSLGRGPRRPWHHPIGVRNRDGITPQSIAWAVWTVLDTLIHASRRWGVPWKPSAAKHLYADAERRGDSNVYGWITNDSEIRGDFPPISLNGILMTRPSWRRLPVPFVRRHSIPVTGPVRAARFKH